MNQESYQYMKDKSDQYNKLSEAKKLLETARDDIYNSSIVIGEVYVTRYLDTTQKQHFREQVSSLLAIEIQEIERKMEEL